MIKSIILIALCTSSGWGGEGDGWALSFGVSNTVKKAVLLKIALLRRGLWWWLSVFLGSLGTAAVCYSRCGVRVARRSLAPAAPRESRGKAAVAIAADRRDLG